MNMDYNSHSWVNKAKDNLKKQKIKNQIVRKQESSLKEMIQNKANSKKAKKTIIKVPRGTILKKIQLNQVFRNNRTPIINFLNKKKKKKIKTAFTSIKILKFHQKVF